MRRNRPSASKNNVIGYFNNILYSKCKISSVPSLATRVSKREGNCECKSKN